MGRCLRAGAAAAAMAHAHGGGGGRLRDRSSLSRQHDLGLFSDLNYTTVGDPYDDIALRRMLQSRTGAWGGSSCEGWCCCCCPLCLCTPCSAPCPLGTTTRRCRGIFAPHRRRQPVRSHRHRARGRAGVYRGMQSGLGTGVTSCRRSRWRRGCRARSSGLPLPRGRHRRGRRRGPPRMPSLGPPPGWKTLTRASGTRSRRTGSRSRTRCSSATSSRQVAPSHCARCRAKSPRNQRPASSRSERPGHPLLLFLPCPPPLLSAALLRRRRSQLPRVCVMAAAHSAMK